MDGGGPLSSIGRLCRQLVFVLFPFYPTQIEVPGRDREQTTRPHQMSSSDLLDVEVPSWEASHLPASSLRAVVPERPSVGSHPPGAPTLTRSVATDFQGAEVASDEDSSSPVNNADKPQPSTTVIGTSTPSALKRKTAGADSPSIASAERGATIRREASDTNGSAMGSEESLRSVLLGGGAGGEPPAYIPFGPLDLGVLLPTIIFYVCFGYAVGAWYCRDRPERKRYGRTDVELRYIVLHNSFCGFLALVAWQRLSRELALIAFALEISYEVFDSVALYRRFGRVDHETVIHHLCAPLCILFSTQTSVDFRILCHLLVCIDLSGAALALARISMRTGRYKIATVYRKIFPLYLYFRILGPYFDTLLILHNMFAIPGNLQTWTQLYFLCMMACNVLNGYFCTIIWQKGWRSFGESQLKNWED